MNGGHVKKSRRDSQYLAKLNKRCFFSDGLWTPRHITRLHLETSKLGMQA